MWTIETNKYQEMICRVQCSPGGLMYKIMELQDEVRKESKDTKAVLVYAIVPEGKGYYTVILHRHIKEA